VGDLPFVTAGESDTGVSAFIGNDVQVFPAGSFTIDMFGSAKFRNYSYGGDDHVAVVHTENLTRNAAIFVTGAAHKAAHTGAFDYGRNFYAKDADALDISLPVKDGKPDWELMDAVIGATHKLVVQGVAEFAACEVEASRQIIGLGVE
jgi:type IIS restriction enzyme protein